MESYHKQLHIRIIKCHLTKYGAFRSLFWDKMYTLFGSAPKSALRSQRVKRAQCKMYNRSCFLLNNVTRRRSTHDLKLMTMHRYAFVQKCSALTSTALPPPRLNVQLTLSGEKVNMSTAPYTLKIYLFQNLGLYKE